MSGKEGRGGYTFVQSVEASEVERSGRDREGKRMRGIPGGETRAVRSESEFGDEGHGDVPDCQPVDVEVQEVPLPHPILAVRCKQSAAVHRGLRHGRGYHGEVSVQVRSKEDAHM